MFIVMGLRNWCRTHKILHYQIVFGLKLLEFITCFFKYNVLTWDMVIITQNQNQ